MITKDERGLDGTAWEKGDTDMGLAPAAQRCVYDIRSDGKSRENELERCDRLRGVRALCLL